MYFNRKYLFYVTFCGEISLLCVVDFLLFLWLFHVVFLKYV